MRCKCGCMMIWNCDYIHGVFVSWYSCPMCGYERLNQYTYIALPDVKNEA